MDNLSKIAIFLAVAQQRSFAGAARQLGITGPAVSKAVMALEERLGVRLLHRTTRQVSLSEEGLLYSEQARKALDALQEAENQLQERRDHPIGLLKISAPMSFGKEFLAGPIAAFACQYPTVQMEVDFDDRRVDMLAEGYDVVVRIGALDDSSLIQRRLASCPILLCAAPSHIARYGLPQDPAQLGEQPAIIYTRNGQVNEWRYAAPDGGTGVVALRQQMGANSAEMMREACVQGVGVAALPIFAAARYLQTGQLQQLLPGYITFPERDITAIFPANRHLSSKSRLFINWLVEASKKLPWS